MIELIAARSVHRLALSELHSVSRLILVLLGISSIVLLSMLAFPVFLIILAQQDQSGFLLEVSLGLYSSRLRIRVYRRLERAKEDSGDDNDDTDFDGLLLQIFGLSSSEARSDGRTKRPLLLRGMNKRDLLLPGMRLVRRSIGRPGWQCVKFDVRAQLGLGDAFWTALAVGLAYAGFGSSQQLLRDSLRFAPGVVPVIDLRPSFQSEGATGALDCIFRISLGYIIGREVARLVRTRVTSGKVA